MDSKKKWLIFLVTICGTSVVFLDNTLIPIALRAIQQELAFLPIHLVWVVNSYLLSLTAFLLIAGKMCDLLGKKASFVTGLAIFALGSLIGVMSYTKLCLILGRVVQGIGGALIIPAVGAIIISSFPRGERARAIGINTGISAIFLIVGPLLGGVLTQYFGWRSIFLIYMPTAIFGIIAAILILRPEKKQKEPFHFLGALTTMLTIVSLVVGLMQANQWGWGSPLTLLLFALSGIFFGCFWYLSARTPYPIVDFRFFRLRLFAASNVFVFITQSVIMVTVLWAIYFQNQMEFSPMKTGMIIFMAVAPVFFMAPLGGYIGDRYGPRKPLLVGFALLTFSLFWLLFTAHSDGLSLLVPGLVCFGGGIPMIFSPAIAMALSQVPRENLGAASGITTATRQLAGTFGIALMTAIYFFVGNFTDSNKAAFSAISCVAGFISFIGFFLVFFIVDRPRKYSR